MPALSGWMLKQGDIYRLETWMSLFYLLGGGMIAGVLIIWLGNYSLLKWARGDDETDSEESSPLYETK